MSDLDKSLAKLGQFLEKYPNASVRVKFPNSVNYRHFPSDPVTNDSFCDTYDSGLIESDEIQAGCDTTTTVLSFFKCFKINALDDHATVATPGSTPVASADDHATAEPQTRTPLGVRLDAGDAPTVDWADLGERDFEKALQTITSIDELNGLANRRRVLSQDFKKWNEAQIGLILNRKFILENKNG